MITVTDRITYLPKGASIDGDMMNDLHKGLVDLLMENLRSLKSVGQRVTVTLTGRFSHNKKLAVSPKITGASQDLKNHIEKVIHEWSCSL